MSENDRIIERCLREVTYDLVRSSGPGGQNVNKVSTAVQLRFDLSSTPHLAAPVKRRLRHLAGRKVSPRGVLVIHASSHRTQEQNRQAARKRFRDLLHAALVPPRRRLPTKATAASKERRLRTKKLHARLKAERRGQDS